MTNSAIDQLIQQEVIRPAHYDSLLVNYRGHRLLPHRSSYMFVWLDGLFALLFCRRRALLRNTCSFASCLSPLPAHLKSVALMLCNNVLVTFKSSYWVITSWHKTLVKLWSDSLQVHVGPMLHSLHTGITGKFLFGEIDWKRHDVRSPALLCSALKTRNKLTVMHLNCPNISKYCSQ